MAGSEVIKGIRDKWDEKFAVCFPAIKRLLNTNSFSKKGGIVAQNYIGDIYGSLGGNPQFKKSVFLS